MQTVDEIARRLGANAEAFCRTYLPNGRRAGNYWKVGDVTGAAGASLAIRLHSIPGKPAGKWTDFQSGEHGDLIDLIPSVTNACDFRDIMDEARAFLKQPVICRTSRPATGRSAGGLPATPADRTERAQRLWAIGRPITGTPAQTYLQSRGITRFGPALGWHEAVHYRNGPTDRLERAPALLARITDHAGNLTGIARTFLDIERGTVADIVDPKRVMGQLMGQAVRFGEPSPLLLAVGEGIETVLSVGTALPGLSLAACLSATHLGLLDVPDTVRELWILKDNDAAGARAAAHLRERLANRNIGIHAVEPVLGDFNDDLQAWGPQALFERFCHDFGTRITQLGQRDAERSR